MKRSKRTTFSKYRHTDPVSNVSDGCTQTDLSKDGLKEIISIFIRSQNQLRNKIGQKLKEKTTADNGSSIKLTFDEWLKYFIDDDNNDIDDDESLNFSTKTSKQVTEMNLQESCLDNEIHVQIEIDSNYLTSDSEPADSLEADENITKITSDTNNCSPHMTRSRRKKLNMQNKNSISLQGTNRNMETEKCFSTSENDSEHNISVSQHYTCDICEEGFKLHAELNKHKKEDHFEFIGKCLNVNSRAGKHPCEICGKVLGDVKSLGSHVKLHETVIGNECKEPFNEKNVQHQINLKQNGKIPKGKGRKSKNNNECPICQRSTKNPVRHMLTHLAEVPTMCKFCAKILNSAEELNSHLDTHTADEIFVCDSCGKAFSSQGRLNEHNRIHIRAALEKRPIFVCELCNIGFLVEQHLQEHKECHTNSTDFKCAFCSNTFSKIDDLKTHIFTYEGEKMPVNCPVCDIICPTKNWHSRHNMKKHLKNHMCSICGKQFSDNLDLRRHTMLHTGNFKHKCQICGKGFIRLDVLNLHMCIHTGEKPFSCKHCGCTFYVESLLKRHLLQHDSNAEFICSKCNLSFQNQEKLATHLRKHKKNHPIICSYCDMAFVDTRYRRNHMRSVHGVKDFVCDICTEEFNCRVDLINHKSAVHGPEYVYTCNICSKMFVKKIDLTVHIRKTHKKNIKMWPVQNSDDLKTEMCEKTKRCSKSEKLTANNTSIEEKTAVTNSKQCSVCGTNQVQCVSVDESSVCDKCKEVEKSNIINASENILLEIPSEIVIQGPTPGDLTCLACSKTFALLDSFIAHMHEHPDLLIKIETVQ